MAIKGNGNFHLCTEVNSTHLDVGRYLIPTLLRLTRQNIPLGVAGSIHSLDTCMVSSLTLCTHRVIDV
jgi:hypothetical protein